MCNLVDTSPVLTDGLVVLSESREIEPLNPWLGDDQCYGDQCVNRWVVDTDVIAPNAGHWRELLCVTCLGRWLAVNS
jgi:hypothetical protein